MDEESCLWDQGGDSDSNIPEEGPTVPPPGWLEVVTGYDQNHGGDGDGTDKLYPPPPEYGPLPGGDRTGQFPTVRVPVVSEEVAREALVEFVEKRWTYRSKPAREMRFTDLKPFTVYRYRLKTYMESRSSAWEFEPYTSQFVDGPQYGASPLPWDITVEAPPIYTDASARVRVPHTCYVKVCHQCSGKGKVKCKQCHGKGKTRCSSCHGNGKRRDKRCSFCSGSGKRRCWDCSAKGHKTCQSCAGHKNLLHFIELTVSWKNHISEFVPDRTPEFPIKKFAKVSGDAFFMDESAVVYPFLGFPDAEICEMSKKFIEEHLSKFSSMTRIIIQCQTIELVPLTHIFCIYKGKDFNYFVYGIENKVYPFLGFPDAEICEMSKKFIEEHLSKFSSMTRILIQCQTIELVPLTHIFCIYKGKDFNYFVYGIENKVYPFLGFPDSEICKMSKKVIEEHLSKFSSMTRILIQCQTIELVPLTHIFCIYKGKDFNYFVYGIENKVYPFLGFPDAEICNMSKKFIEEHLSKFSSMTRILIQCQTIELVPLTHIFCIYKGKDFNYFVYGIENKVYAPNYPSSCLIL